MTKKGWQRLGTIRPTELVAARLELHWAAQVPAALGIARAEATADFAQHALTFDAAHQALVSALVPGGRPYRAGLRLAEGSLLLLDQRGSLVDTLALKGKTLRAALDWLEAASLRYTGDEAPALALPEHELPEHPLGKGAPFGASEPAARSELARWFADLALVLGEVRQDRGASPLRVWSHHFDLDTLLDLGNARTIGLGFSPGDDSYGEPYLYLLPTPAPDEGALPHLTAPFEWVTDGWLGAVLPGSRVVTLAADAQAELVERFYRSTEEILRRALS